MKEPVHAGVLAVDIGSGGVTAAVIDPDLRVRSLAESEWVLLPDASGVAALSASFVLESVILAIRDAVDRAPGSPPAALVLSSMMHTLVLTDPQHLPRTPVFTWLDRAGFSGESGVRKALGSDYRRRTGAWFHPSFPAYKLARLAAFRPDLVASARVHSVRSWIQHALTHTASEDESSASASGLLRLETGRWDPDTVSAIGLEPGTLLPVVSPSSLVGDLTADRARILRLPAGTRVIAGGGDGPLAAIGSGGAAPGRAALTLGTTSAVRSFVTRPYPGDTDGQFCYRFGPDRFLLGSASSNGGNVIDWARERFGTDGTTASGARRDLPVFVPFVFGERSPFWNPRLGPEWVGITASHSPSDLLDSVVESVALTMAEHSNRLWDAAQPQLGILSGNGFRNPRAAGILAALAPFPIRMPESPGAATLRGAAILAFHALGVGTDDALSRLLEASEAIPPDPDPGLKARFESFRQRAFSRRASPGASGPEP